MFGRYNLVRYLLRCDMVLKDVLSNKTGVDPKCCDNY